MSIYALKPRFQAALRPAAAAMARAGVTANQVTLAAAAVSLELSDLVADAAIAKRVRKGLAETPGGGA